MKKLTMPFIVSALFWLMLSGHYNPLMLFFGFVSCLFVAIIVANLPSVSPDDKPHKIIAKLFTYLPWLTIEIIKANIDVAKIVWSPKLPISPTLVEVHASQSTPLGLAIHANSITLTPGTVSIDVEGAMRDIDKANNFILVHSLTRDAALDSAQGVINRKVTALENSGFGGSSDV